MDTLKKCLMTGTSPVQVVRFASDYLREAGFQELAEDTALRTEAGGKYFITPFPDVIFAFTRGQRNSPMLSMRMAFAHVDQPCFKVKGNPSFKNLGCSQLNVEVYGGMKDHTWFDRPLGLSGMIVRKGEDAFHPIVSYYDSKRPVAVIPGLAIHMQRDANKGWQIDRQKELMPLTGLAGGGWSEEDFLCFLAREIGVAASEILTFDLNLYNFDPPQLCGLENELLVSPRLDNLVSVSALLESLVEGERTRGINLIGLFNHEEVGSVSKSGANSELLSGILHQIALSVGAGPEETRTALERSCYLSVDGAQAAHPNYPDRADATTRAILGRGTAVKVNSSQKYASDVLMHAVLKGLAEKYDFPLQEINDRNTIPGGRTLGPMIGAHIPMAGCDVGVPMLAMHSARETMAIDDYDSLCQLITAFFLD